jgi:hypothetical protein
MISFILTSLFPVWAIAAAGAAWLPIGLLWAGRNALSVAARRKLIGSQYAVLMPLGPFQQG